MYTPPMPPPPSPGPHGSAQPGRAARRWKAVALVAGVAVLVLAVLAFALARDHAPEAAVPEDNAASAPSSVEPPRGEATAAARQATRTVSGLPRGFPRTEAGAVEAGASYVSSIDELYRMTSFERWRYVRDAMVDPPSAARLDEDAEASSMNGAASDCHPQLGAYRVVESTPDEAVVDYWMPCLTESAGVHLRWQMGRIALLWNAGDWRVGELTRGPFGQLVTPADKVNPVTTFAERLALLGEGWELFADATETWPAAPPSGGPW